MNLRKEDSVREAEFAILNAPFDADGWERAVLAIARATGSNAAHLLGIGGPILFPLNVFVGDVPGIERYLGDPVFHGAINWRVGSVTAPMAIQYEPDYEAYRRLHDTSDYDDVASDLDIQYGCQCAVLLDSRNMLGIALLRSRSDGRCTDETLSRFSLLRHQLARAVRVQMALDGEAAEMMVGNLDERQCATLLLDRHANLCAMSPAAEPLFDERGPLTLSGLAVELRNRGENRAFQKALARLLASDGHRGAVVHETRVGRDETALGGRWRLFAVRLPHRQDGLGFDPHLAVTLKPLF
ncbi:MAG: hypothetical protein ACLGHC_07690 [Alphaproteobacteria bacterium]